MGFTESDPSAIIKMPVDIMQGMTPEIAKSMADQMGFTEAQSADAAALIGNLYRVCIDDNAEYRQKHIFDQKDESQEDPTELEAKKYDLNYIKLDGSVACMVNGAGLAMSTMDLLSTLGGEPANFLDVGGASTVATMTAAFKIIMADPNVKSIFVNIFGGIARCDHIAEAVVAGVKAVGGNDAIKPLVIRLEGTNVEKGMKIIKESGVNAFLTNNFTEGAKKAVRLGNA